MQANIQRKPSLDVTWGMTLQVFWWWFWRTTLFGVVGGGVIGFIIGFGLGAIGKNVMDYALLIQSVSFCWSIACAIFFLRELVGQSFNGFSIVAVANSI